MEKPKPPIEGVIYGEIAAWVTIIGIIVAVVGIIIGITTGKDLVDNSKLLVDLMNGKSESYIWSHDSILNEPSGYWFFSQLGYGTGIAMTGLAIAIFGGLIGIWAMFLSTFRSKEVLLYKKGLYTLLAFAIALIITLAATGIISLRH